MTHSTTARETDFNSANSTVVEGYAAFRSYRTWYRVVGDLDARQAPLIVVHGGPAAGHDALVSYADLAAEGRAVVFYDQLGCGRSTRLPEADADFWTFALFLEELANLLATLGIADNYHLLGHSWGSFVVAEHAATHPAGLSSLVLADSGVPQEVMAGREQARTRLPEDVQAALRQHEAAGTTDSPEYMQAAQMFYERHLLRTRPWPDEAMRSLANMQEGMAIITTLTGPDAVTLTGRLRDWNMLDCLRQIQVPTLCLNGTYEPVAAVLPFLEHIPDVRWAVLPNSSHFPNIEERDLTMRIVGTFLNLQDN
ncbi:MAG: proline iminopeptidase-family hydrolase [Pseudonocardia sp.]